MDTEVYLPEEGTCYVYKLVDPRDNAIKYIGATVNPKSRFESHAAGRSNSSKAKSRWHDELKDARVIPQFFVIEPCAESERVERELFWINSHISAGHPLLNRENTPREKRHRTIRPGKKISVLLDREHVAKVKQRGIKLSWLVRKLLRAWADGKIKLEV